MTEVDTQSALAGGIGGGAGTGVVAVAERFFAVSYPASMAIAVAVGVVVALGLLFVIRA